MTAYVQVAGTKDECAAVLEILGLAADVEAVRIEEPGCGCAVVSATVAPDALKAHNQAGVETADAPVPGP